MFRDFEPRDRGAFLKMAGALYASGATAHAVSGRNFERTFDEILGGGPYARGIMIEWDGRAEGYALLARTWSNEAGGMAVWVEEIYISEALRGRGIAGRFFHFLEEEYPDAARFRLEVHESNNRAMALYERLGYERLDYVQMIRDRKA